MLHRQPPVVLPLPQLRHFIEQHPPAPIALPVPVWPRQFATWGCACGLGHLLRVGNGFPAYRKELVIKERSGFGSTAIGMDTYVANFATEAGLELGTRIIRQRQPAAAQGANAGGYLRTNFECPPWLGLEVNHLFVLIAIR